MTTKEEIDLSKATRIAFADTKHLGRERWSELSVFYLPEPLQDGRRWVALSVGMSDRQGERPIVDRLVTFGLERALDLFDGSKIGQSVQSQARDWAEAHFGQDYDAGHPVVPQGAKPAAGERFTGSTDAEALAWLFGPDVSRRKMGDALGVGESTLRQQIDGKGVRVPLLTLLPFIDREAFRAALQPEVASAS